MYSQSMVTLLTNCVSYTMCIFCFFLTAFFFAQYWLQCSQFNNRWRYWPAYNGGKKTMYQVWSCIECILAISLAVCVYVFKRVRNTRFYMYSCVCKCTNFFFSTIFWLPNTLIDWEILTPSLWSPSYLQYILVKLTLLFPENWWRACWQGTPQISSSGTLDGALLPRAGWLHIWQCVHVLMTSPCVKYWGN